MCIGVRGTGEEKAPVSISESVSFIFFSPISSSNNCQRNKVFTVGQPGFCK